MLIFPNLEPNTSIVGYAYLIETYQLSVPLPKVLASINTKHVKYETKNWKVFTPRHQPDNTLYGHLAFSLRYEGINFLVLKKLFDEINPQELEAFIIRMPNGIYSRKIWFLYEFIKDVTLNIPDAKKLNYSDLIDPKLQYPGPIRPSKRHKINNNLPGVKDFCPLVTRTSKIDNFIKQNLAKETLKNIGKIHPDILCRASAFLLLEDSKASYAIEGEQPTQSRAERWGRIIGSAGRTPLSKKELERLQLEVITDTRFIHMGFRKEGGFIGTHDRSTNLPIPDHISAKETDLDQLMNGLIETAELLKNSNYPPILTATIIAFGFVFIHPFEDGNGRLHRYLLHHILLESGFTPKGIVFPVSAVILKRIFDYRRILESYSKPLLQHIKWHATENGNIKVTNNTIDFYRYFDATIQAEFFYECVHETITKSLPEEVAYLQKYDAMKTFINNFIDMPDRTADLLIRFLHQNNGKFSRRARDNEFTALTDLEVITLENKFNDIFS